ncbi:TIGR00725 family protein [Bizionia sp. M204]|uniref:TIGR00725 family protein n=1 Tax=Bizionia sp. M204 TaxID=2675331 RepID=UPI00204AA88A|nr:TIGR00725 family protein [Bizionia sp. M204]UPS91391.1 TIGR00725 family protein [Bizionia sp. M204]
MQIGIIGSNESQCSKELYEFAYALGVYLGQKEFTVINGGMQGTMEAVSKGVKSVKDTKCKVVGILPFEDGQKANKYLDITIPTGIGFARNSVLVLSSNVLIALGGGAGTLNEISYAWQFGKKVFCYTGAEGWSKKLANQNLDNRKENLLIGFNSLDELCKLLFDD